MNAFLIENKELLKRDLNIKNLTIAFFLIMRLFSNQVNQQMGLQITDKEQLQDHK